MTSCVKSSVLLLVALLASVAAVQAVTLRGQPAVIDAIGSKLPEAAAVASAPPTDIASAAPAVASAAPAVASAVPAVASAVPAVASAVPAVASAAVGSNLPEAAAAIASAPPANIASAPAIEAPPQVASKLFEDPASAGIGSLPPISPGGPLSGPASMVPLALLPSNVNVVTHEPNYGDVNPSRRPSCLNIVREIERSTIRNRESPTFGAFETIIGVLTTENRTTTDDKVIDYAIDGVMNVRGPNALAWNYIASLRNCAVDEHGRTIFMKLVQLGLLTSLQHRGSPRLNGVPIHELKDTFNNNILHLAVMSRNVHIVEIILDLIGVDHTISILSHKNIEGLKPVDLATQFRLEDVTTLLKGRFATASYVSKYAMRRTHQSAEVIRASDGPNGVAAAAAAAAAASRQPAAAAAA